MKTQIILLASLLVLSIQSFAGEPIEPTMCEMSEAKVVVNALVEEEGGASFKESLMAVGKRMKADLQQVLNDNETASFTDPEAVEEIIKKSSCIFELSLGTSVSEEFRNKMKSHEKDIAKKSGLTFLKIPANPKTVELQNLDRNSSLIYFNRETVSFMFATF